MPLFLRGREKEGRESNGEKMHGFPFHRLFAAIQLYKFAKSWPLLLFDLKENN
jgi:hypothetical protein